ncbi:MAG: RecQ family ATP-dependent DNA helicase [Deltaproteobacteria bacterium]|nr:RecQ family ATP-dependent DNA helicase [Deltaproteobacteria bacterium]
MVQKRTKKDSAVAPSSMTAADSATSAEGSVEAMGQTLNADELPAEGTAKRKTARTRKPRAAAKPAIEKKAPTRKPATRKAAADKPPAVRKPRVTRKKVGLGGESDVPALPVPPPASRTAEFVAMPASDVNAEERYDQPSPGTVASESQLFDEVLGEHKELPDLHGELLGLAPPPEPLAKPQVTKRSDLHRQPAEVPRRAQTAQNRSQHRHQHPAQQGQPRNGQPQPGPLQERSGSRRSRRRRRRGGRKSALGAQAGTNQAQRQEPPAPPPRDDRPTDPAHMAARRLGIDRLYPEQERTIIAALNGRDVLVVQPTGFGKSACYQVPSMMMAKPVVLVSPLLALLRDQHEKLFKRNIPVERIDGTVRGVARREALQRIAAGGSMLVMTTPETLANEEMGATLHQSGIALAAVDEAHCISEWGHDFRPAYMRLGERLRELGSPPVLALTATATQTVRDDIVRYLGMRDPEIVASSPHRANLAFEVMQIGGASRLRAMTRFIKRLQRPGIIYCATTKMVDDIYGALRLLRLPVHRYHGRMAAKDLNTEQEMYMRPKRRTIMVATSAFGLGIDKPDIRYIVHAQAPASLEQYVQEAGCAWRDGRKANCVLLYDPADREVHEVLQQTSRIRPDQLYRISSALAAYAGEGRQPDLEGLTLSAQLGDRQTQALLVVLEEAGLIAMEEGSIRVTVPAGEFEELARSLAGRFVTLRTQDGRRLDRLSEYVNAKECRAVFLRRYFGEPDGEPCALCDICRGAKERPVTFFQPIARPEPKRRGRKRRRRRRGRGGQGGGGQSGGSSGAQVPAGPGPSEGAS